MTRTNTNPWQASGPIACPFVKRRSLGCDTSLALRGLGCLHTSPTHPPARVRPPLCHPHPLFVAVAVVLVVVVK